MSAVLEAWNVLQRALREHLPQAAERLRPPVPCTAEFLNHPGAEQLGDLWSVTSGQKPDTMGILGGLCLFGPEESAGESDKWRDLMTSGQGFQAIANPDWDASHSLDPDAVNAVYFAAGWIPLLGEPLEANYLAVDLVPLSSGVPGQVILCGRDEDHKCVVAPDLTALLKALAAECNGGAWEVVKGKSKTQDFFYMKRQGGRLLSACKAREFPPRKGNVQ